MDYFVSIPCFSYGAITQAWYYHICRLFFCPSPLDDPSTQTVSPAPPTPTPNGFIIIIISTLGLVMKLHHHSIPELPALCLSLIPHMPVFIGLSVSVLYMNFNYYWEQKTNLKLSAFLFLFLYENKLTKCVKRPLCSSVYLICESVFVLINMNIFSYF